MMKKNTARSTERGNRIMLKKCIFSEKPSFLTKMYGDFYRNVPKRDLMGLA